MPKWLYWTLIVVAALVIVAFAIVQTAWLLARDEVGKLRASLEKSQPVPPLVESAIIAAEHGQMPNTLTKYPPPGRRRLPWRIRTTIATYVITRVFTPEELLQIYANEVYLGRLDGRDIYSMEAGSMVYFARPMSRLTPAQAATLAGIIRNPNVYSPRYYPAFARARRNDVLEAMLELGSLSESEYRSAIAEP